jgi:hypothetical protein
MVRARPQRPQVVDILVNTVRLRDRRRNVGVPFRGALNSNSKPTQRG